ncbi:cytochrome P450 71A1-like [Senna tora]|uniref:Cytochrome P450 71A1-like n=1 Tax=Senna tora TaxID=362788 RepID=A0A834X5C8_9FABA|nr:cytochrome P450 71A1-like [Senna tora]
MENLNPAKMALAKWLKEGFLPLSLLPCIFLVVLTMLLLSHKSRKRRSNLPPGPPAIPIIGNLHQLGSMAHLSLQRLAAKYGPIIYLQLGQIPTVVASSARVAKEVLKTHDLALASQPQLFAAKHLFYNCTNVVFSPYGAYWRHIRKICILELLSAKRVQSYSCVREEEVARLVCRIAESSPGMKTRLKDTFRRFDKLFDQILNEHVSSSKKEEYSKDLVDVLLEIQKNGSDEMPLTTDNIKAIILDMFAAGTDTTFITLDWAMTELVMNPLVMEKAQNEVRGIMGERRVVLESDLPQLQYIKAVIKEIFRYHPPVPVLVPRESMEDVIIDGYKIPAKTRVFVNVWAIGRDQESWEDSKTFRPERFIGSDIDFRGQDFELIPFGAGRRGCPAITFGTAVVELALAQLLHSFDWELPPGITAEDLDLTEVFGISMHRRENLYVIAKPHFP